MFWFIAGIAGAADVDEGTSAAGAEAGMLVATCGPVPAHKVCKIHIYQHECYFIL